MPFPSLCFGGLPSFGILRAESPDKRYLISLSDGEEFQASYLTISKNGEPLARYLFRGELINVCWSPSGNFVAINNHYGHSGWWIWVISLSDGAVITDEGRQTGSGFDRYEFQYKYFKDMYYYFKYIPPFAKKQMSMSYPEYEKDSMRSGFISVAYGWLQGDKLLEFYMFPYDGLSQNRIIYGYAKDEIKNEKLSMCYISLKIVSDRDDREIPAEVLKIFNFYK